MKCKSRRFAALVAAAGASQRMGQPKALLRYHQQSFVTHAIGEMLAAGAWQVIVTLPEGAMGVQIEQALCAEFEHDERVMTSPNDWIKQSYSGSIQSALSRCPDVDAWVIAPVDAPFFDARLVSDLLAALGPAHDAAVPRAGGRWGHPIAFSQRLRDALASLHDTGGPRALLESLGPRLACVEWPDARVTWNLNTPADYREAFAHAVGCSGESAPSSPAHGDAPSGAHKG